MHIGNCCSQGVAEWPASWDEERRQSFSKRILLFGFHSPETLPNIAQNLETLGASEQDLVDYLLLAKVSQERLAKVYEDSRSMTRWSTKLMGFFMVSIKDHWIRALIKMVVLMVIFVPAYLLNLPARIITHYRMTKIVRRFPSTFGEFVSDRRSKL